MDSVGVKTHIPQHLRIHGVKFKGTNGPLAVECVFGPEIARFLVREKLCTLVRGKVDLIYRPTYIKLESELARRCWIFCSIPANTLFNVGKSLFC